jgi:hypothetical protein
LKFAVAKGEDIDQIEDLKGFLAERTKAMGGKGQKGDTKHKKEIKNLSEWGLEEKDMFLRKNNNNSNKFYAFTQMENLNENK